MKLTPEDLEKLRTKEVANAIRKLHAGKTLTGAERALLAQQSVGGSDTAAGGFAQTWDELAQRLNTTRRSLQEWRKDPRYTADAPRPQADGRLDVAAFAAWMVKHSLKRADERVGDSPIGGEEHDAEDEPIIHPPRLSGSQADWKKAEIRLGVERRQIEIDTLRGTLIVAAELEIPLGATFAAIQTKLAQFPSTAARFVVGLRDVAEAEEVLRNEMDVVLGELHGAAYLDTIPAELVAELPFDAESGRLLKLVTFDGQDRTNLLQLIAHLVGEALRRLGRRTIGGAADAKRSCELLDEDTGQVTDEASEQHSAARQAGVSSALATTPAAGVATAPAPPAKGSRSSAPSKTTKGAKRKAARVRKPAAPSVEMEALASARPSRAKVRKQTRRRKA